MFPIFLGHFLYNLLRISKKRLINTQNDDIFLSLHRPIGPITPIVSLLLY